MFKILRKNQKIVMVLFAVVLMVMFVAQLGQQGGPQQTSPVLRQVAKLDGAKVTQLQLNNSKAEWELLKGLQYVDPNQPNQEMERPRPFVDMTLGPQLVNEIEQSYKSSQGPPLFFLLVAEAKRVGMTVTQEELQSVITNNVSPSGEPGSDERDRVEIAVGDCILVHKLAAHVESVIKVSRPYQDFTLANMAQNLVVGVETLHANSYVKDVPEPTEAEISAQFDKYKDRVAAVTDRNPSEFGQADDPLGFGYKTPNRVAVQYIGVRADDVRQAAMASKSPEDWYVAAFGDFKANQSDYDAQPVPATQPSSTTQPADTVKKLPDLEQDFALHAPLVLKKLYDQQFETLRQQILKEFNEKLSSGFGTYRDQVTSLGNADHLTGDAAAYVNFKFIHDLADSIQAKDGVTPVVGDIRQFKSESQLADLAGIGASVVPSVNLSVNFPDYAVHLFQPWLSDADKNSLRGSLAIALWQPSTTLVNGQGDVYLFRISGSDASHVPALGDVKDQVAIDCKIAAGYAKALQAGHDLLGAANSVGLDAAAAQSKAKLPPPIVTEQFSPEEIASGHAPAVINPLILTSDSARQFATVSGQLLITAPSHDNRRQLLAELYADRTVAVIELHEAKPSWDEETRPMYTFQVTSILESQQAVPMELSLFKPDAVAARVNYQALSK